MKLTAQGKAELLDRWFSSFVVKLSSCPAIGMSGGPKGWIARVDPVYRWDKNSQGWVTWELENGSARSPRHAIDQLFELVLLCKEPWKVKMKDQYGSNTQYHYITWDDKTSNFVDHDLWDTDEALKGLKP